MEKTPLILVVDDEERNLRLMESILIAKNYSVSIARDGAEALAKAGSELPDVILLDVMMPVMDGFEACRRLKADAQTAPIPVLLVTALESRPDRLKGIEAGATDFISKPIDIEYLLLKVRNALYAKNLFNMAQKNYEEQKRLEEVRDKLTHMIVHDLRTPLMGISGNMELLKLQAGSLLAPEQMRYVDHATFAVWTMVELVNSILAVNRFEQGNIEIKLNQDNLKDIALEAIELLGSMKSKCRILVVCSPEPPCAPCDRDLIRRVMLNLLSNAVKYTTSGENIRSSTIKKYSKNSARLPRARSAGCIRPASDLPSARWRSRRTAGRSASKARRGRGVPSGSSCPARRFWKLPPSDHNAGTAPAHHAFLTAP